MHSEKKSVPVLFCPPQTPQGVSLGSNPAFCGQRLATKRLRQNVSDEGRPQTSSESCDTHEEGSDDHLFKNWMKHANEQKDLSPSTFFFPPLVLQMAQVCQYIAKIIGQVFEFMSVFRNFQHFVFLYLPSYSYLHDNIVYLLVEFNSRATSPHSLSSTYRLWCPESPWFHSALRSCTKPINLLISMDYANISE